MIPSLVIRACEVVAGDGLVGGAHYASESPSPWLVTASRRHKNSAVLWRISFFREQLVLPRNALVIVQREPALPARTPGTAA